MNAQYILTSVATFIFCGAIAVTSNTDQASGKDASKRSWKWNQVLMYPGKYSVTSNITNTETVSLYTDQIIYFTK